MNDKFQQAIRRFDDENARDPNQENGRPRELLYAERLTDWVAKLKPDAGEALRLAARCQHICRWQSPRENYPMTRPGYLKWRADLKKFHAEKSGAILREVGYDEATIHRVQDLNLKKNFPADAECRVLEDALCLVFLEFQFAPLAAKTDDDKMINALRKSWEKMTDNARAEALKLPYGERETHLIERALKPGVTMAAAKSKPAPQAVPHPAQPPLPAWLVALLLALATLVLYWPTMQNGFVNFDDDRYVTENLQVQKGLSLENLRWAFTNPVADNWHPLTVLSHMFVCQFTGLNPWGHHLANVLLHAANAALVFLLLRQLTGAFWKSFFVAALFAVHPLRVESVAWVAERKDVLSGLFGLLALIFYARYARPNDSKKDGGHFILSRNYWLALVCFTLGLMSKPMLVTWPFVLLLLDYWPLKRISNPKSQISDSETNGGRQLSIPKLVLEKILFFILAAMVSVATFVVQQHGAALKTVQTVSLAIRGENSLIAYCRYLEKTFWPTDLAVFYPLPDYWPIWEVFVAAGFLIAVSALVVLQRRRQPYLPVGWFWFLGTLIPVIGLVQVGLQSMADRYTYLPSLGILMLVVWGASAVAMHWRQEALVVAVGLAGIITCAVMTRLQLPYWQDGETLFRRALAVTQNNPIAHYNLAVALDSKNRLADAVSEYQAVLQIQPGNTLAHLNLGADLYQSGQSGEAIAQYQEAIRLEPNNDKVHNNLGIVLFRQGQNDEAIREFQAAIRLAPDSASYHNSLAAALYTQGSPDEAIQQFQEALRLQPTYAEAHFNLACILVQRGQTDEAIKHFQEAIRLKPDYPEARDRLEKALQIQGKSN